MIKYHLQNAQELKGKSSKKEIISTSILTLPPSQCLPNYRDKLVLTNLENHFLKTVLTLAC